MTQKELAYVEDAIMHEKSINELLKVYLKDISDDEIKKFIEESINKHISLKDNLMNMLKEKSYE